MLKSSSLSSLYNTHKRLKDKNVCYKIETHDGSVFIHQYHIFPGIWFMLKQAETSILVDNIMLTKGFLEITHCIEGKLVYEDECRTFLLEEGGTSVRKGHSRSIVMRCPLRYYRGVSIIIQPELALQGVPCLLDEVKENLQKLYRKFSCIKRDLVVHSIPQLEHVFSQILHIPEAIRVEYFKIKVLELLLFLSGLDPKQLQGIRSYCPPEQAQLAHNVLRYTEMHRDKRFTAREISAALSTTPEHLRACVQKVYGMPLYQCVRSHKMRIAAKLLRETGKSITDIAGEFGYDNISKFAAAFRDVFGVAPTAYRSQKWRCAMQHDCILERKHFHLE